MADPPEPIPLWRPCDREAAALTAGSVILALLALSRLGRAMELRGQADAWRSESDSAGPAQ